MGYRLPQALNRRCRWAPPRYLDAHVAGPELPYGHRASAATGKAQGDLEGASGLVEAQGRQLRDPVRVDRAPQVYLPMSHWIL